MRVNVKTVTMAAGVAMMMGSAAVAQTTPLGDYLKEMDRTEVSFSGRIKYDSSEGEFTFYDEYQERFSVTFDAGRDARERVETECDNPSIWVSYSELCSVAGVGSVEIRGSRIFLSIERLDQLSK